MAIVGHLRIDAPGIQNPNVAKINNVSIIRIVTRITNLVFDNAYIDPSNTIYSLAIRFATNIDNVSE